MPSTGQLLSRGNSHEEIVNLLYKTGFRLTGSHRETAKLVSRTVNVLNKRKQFNSNTALKELCSVYINTNIANLGKTFGNDCVWYSDYSTKEIQEVLLALPPLERLVLVLHEVSGLNYAEIADVTGLEKKTVSRLLATSRVFLREHLIPPLTQRNLSKKDTMAK